MPRTKSAQKALRQNETRRSRNIARKQRIKSAVKGFSKLVKEKNLEEAKRALADVYKTVDKISKNKIIKKGKADRIKSRLTKKLNEAQKNR